MKQENIIILPVVKFNNLQVFFFFFQAVSYLEASLPEIFKCYC